MSYDSPPPPPPSGPPPGGGYGGYGGGQPPYGGQPGYGQGYGQPAKTSGKAIAALVLGILGIPGSCLCIGVILSILGIVFGFIARGDIKKSGGQLTGNGLALAGIITGFVGVAYIIVVTILAATGVIDSSFSYGSV